jgi:hypothetical protein
VLIVLMTETSELTEPTAPSVVADKSNGIPPPATLNVPTHCALARSAAKRLVSATAAKIAVRNRRVDLRPARAGKG